MKSQMKWDQQALEAWLEESAQKDEDALTLQKYAKQDEGKIKELVLKIEKLVDHSQKQKKMVDDETLNTMTIQVNLLQILFFLFVLSTITLSLRKHLINIG